MDRNKLSQIVRLNANRLGSLRAYSRHLGVTLGSVQGWVDGRSKPSTDNLLKIATDAGYTLEELIQYLDGEMQVPSTEAKEQALKYLRLLRREELVQVLNEGTKILAGV